MGRCQGKICKPDTIKEIILSKTWIYGLKIREVIRKLMHKGFRVDIENVIKTLMEGGIL